MMASYPIKDQITVAICCYNAVHYLPNLLQKLMAQKCDFPFEILIINNNSTDNIQEFIDSITITNNNLIRYVIEFNQGIAYARNRAIEESLTSRYLAFIDADEIPESLWLQSAINVLGDDKVDCVGGKISISLDTRPKWLSDDLLPFYGEVNYSDHKFTIIDRSTPIWSGNIAYNTRIFQQGLRFDIRYNRKGKGVGGGEDGLMFHFFLQHHFSLVYEPEMEILHLIPEEKIKRGYFLKLHYSAGKKAGLYERDFDSKLIFGIPRFMFLQLCKKTCQVLYIRLVNPCAYMRETMNWTYQLGMMVGYLKKFYNYK